MISHRPALRLRQGAREEPYGGIPGLLSGVGGSENLVGNMAVL